MSQKGHLALIDEEIKKAEKAYEMATTKVAIKRIEQKLTNLYKTKKQEEAFYGVTNKKERMVSKWS